MRITERKYLDIYKKSIGNQISKLIKDFDFTKIVENLNILQNLQLFTHQI